MSRQRVNQKENKRKKDSSSDDSFVESRRDSKVLKEMAGGSDLDIAEMLKGIDSKIQTLATRDDIKEVRGDMEKAMTSLTHRLEHFESRVYETEKRLDGHDNAMSALRKENERLCGIVNQLTYDHEESVQYGRRNNVKIYGMKEEWKKGTGGRMVGETEGETLDAVVGLFQDELGCDIRHGDIEIAHRLPRKHKDGKERAIIVKFVRRMDRNTVIRHRRALKGKSVVIADDLSPFFMSLFYEFRNVFGKENVWSVEGQVFVKIGERPVKVTRANKEHLLRGAGGVHQDNDIDMNTDRPMSSNTAQGIPVVRGMGRGTPLAAASDLGTLGDTESTGTLGLSADGQGRGSDSGSLPDRRPSPRGRGRGGNGGRGRGSPKERDSHRPQPTWRT